MAGGDDRRSLRSSAYCWSWCCAPRRISTCTCAGPPRRHPVAAVCAAADPRWRRRRGTTTQDQ
jgi:hypothetical protein